MTSPRGTLYLVWQEPRSRAQHKVGELSYDGFSYRFRYSPPDELSLAVAHGFVPAALLPSFPDTGKEYEGAKLFSTFAHRLPDSKRPDYECALAVYGLSVGSDPFDVLRRTRGRLATDQFSFEEAPVVTEAGQVINCWVAGWRYYQGDDVLHELAADTPVDLRRDTNNRHDRSAVAVYSVSGAKLGYVPVYHSDLVFGALSAGRQVDARIVELRLPPAEPSERARIGIRISFGTDEEEVRTKIREKLDRHELPHALPSPLHPTELEGNEPIVIGGATGRICAACERRIDRPETLSIEFKYTGQAPVYLHYRCFELWRELRSESRRRASGVDTRA